MEKKKYIDIISAQADKNHRPHELALNDFLDYLLEFFSVKAFQSGPDTYHQHLLDCTQKCPEFAGLATLWLTDVHTAMEQGKWLDVFGILYEELYLTRGKASHTGQFFTPPSVADIMSRISSLNEKQSGIVKTAPLAAVVSFSLIIWRRAASTIRQDAVSDTLHKT